MNSIQNEIQKLHKLYSLDSSYFIIESYVFIERLLQWFLRSDSNCKFILCIDDVISKVKIDKSSLKNHKLEVLNNIQSSFLKIQSSNGYNNIKDITGFETLINLYELTKIFKFKRTEEYISRMFNDFSDEFDKIDTIYRDSNTLDFVDIKDVKSSRTYKQFDENHIKELKSDFKRIDSTIQDCGKIISNNQSKKISNNFKNTHLEYQKKYWALSDAQNAIIKEISSNLEGCFYVEGVAGSGKSIVLLKLFEIINSNKTESTSYFLTYTNSLVRFDKDGLINTDYKKNLLKNIKTIDAYLSFNLRLGFSDFTVLRDQIGSDDNNYLLKLLDRSISIFNENGGDWHLSNEQTYYLIEYQIFDNLYDKDTCKEHFDSLDIYYIGEIFKSLQIQNKVLSRAFSIICMIDVIKGKNIDGYTDYILVDEAQDLTLAQIELLRLSAKKALILAGDINQSIYLKNSCINDLPFKMKKFKLDENYRNSYEIKTLSNAYLDSFKDAVSIKNVVYEKKNNGLKPRLFKCSNVSSTVDTMIEKINIDIAEFNLDLKDILIICPSNYTIKMVVDRISFPIIYLKDRDVDFNESSIKISTIYSSKGCGFAYIYLFIDNKIYTNSSLNKDDRNLVLKRLIYVSLTRSMNSLNVFIPLSKYPLKPIYNLLKIME